MNDLVEQGLDALAGLSRHPQAVVGFAADEVRELGGVLVGLGSGQVDLVQHGDDVQVVLEREVEVGQGLRLDALRRVDQQHRALAGGERARDLVGEVDVTWGVDHVQDVVATVGAGPRQPDRLRLDRDADARARCPSGPGTARASGAGRRRRSAGACGRPSVDLPWSMWAMMQKFRITDGSVDSRLRSTADRGRGHADFLEEASGVRRDAPSSHAGPAAPLPVRPARGRGSANQASGPITTMGMSRRANATLPAPSPATS